LGQLPPIPTPLYPWRHFCQGVALMNFATKMQREPGAVPLQNAVLCVDCECVTNGRLDECSVCGSHSLLSLAKIIGGDQLTPTAPRPGTNPETRFEVKIAIGWNQILPRELCGAIESIDRLIGPWLVNGQASCHIDVAPVPGIGKPEEARAA